MTQLRPYQVKAVRDIYSEWDKGHKNVMLVLPTGAGKTVVFSDIINNHNGNSCVVAHRQELVSQISLALGRVKVKHRIIGPKNVVKLCVRVQMDELGVHYYDGNARCAVAGVRTLTSKKQKIELSDWCKSVTLYVQDEAHHVLVKNEWGKGIRMCPNTKMLGVTATACRADGHGLGSDSDGLFDKLVVGPGMRDLINEGYLTDYRIFSPPSDLLVDGKAGGSGDYSNSQLKEASKNSHIVGDVVEHYQRIAAGMLGVTFATDVETATDIAKKFNDAGIPAAMVCAKTKDSERIAIIRKFKNRELMQLVNVDLFGEGFDLPAIEVISMARPTESFSLYIQQFGRALRIMDGKKFAIIIDHVGNVIRHGLPDTHRVWSLDRRDKRGSGVSDAIPVRVCIGKKQNGIICNATYTRILKICPECGYAPIPADRSSPEHVDGDLVELDAETLAEMRGDIDKVDMPKEEFRALCARKHMPIIGQHANVKRHVATQEMQEALRASMTWWSGYQVALGRSASEGDMRFYFRFGIDKMSAQALKAKDALVLANKVNEHLGELAK